MKAVLVFSLPDDAGELRGAQMGSRLYGGLRGFLETWLRSRLKHGHGFKTAKEALEAVRDELGDLLDDCERHDLE